MTTLVVHPRQRAARRQRARAVRQEHRPSRAPLRRALRRRHAHPRLLARRGQRLDGERAPRDGRRHRRAGARASSSSTARASSASARRSAPLDCGNSGTTMRLLCGVLAAQRFRATLVGDASLSRRPMMRVVGPASLARRAHRGRAAPDEGRRDHRAARRRPAARGARTSRALEYESPVASAQVKSALLLSGLYAHGTTYFTRADRLARSHRAHAARARRPAPHRRLRGRARSRRRGTGEMPRVRDRDPRRSLGGGVPPRRRAARRGLARHRARRRREPDAHRPPRDRARHGRRARDRAAGRAERASRSPSCTRGSAPLARRRRSAARSVPRAIDEIPIACALAARARGTTRIRDAEELRVKESDRIATMASVLRAFGVDVRGDARRPRHRGPRDAPLDAGRRRQPRRSPHRDDGGGARARRARADARARRRLHRHELPEVRRDACARSARAIDVENAVDAKSRVTTPRDRPIVAIDGPAGAGKSTVARRLADALGFVLVDTGALYRTVALAAKRARRRLGRRPSRVGALAAGHRRAARRSPFAARPRARRARASSTARTCRDAIRDARHGHGREPRLGPQAVRDGAARPAAPGGARRRRRPRGTRHRHRRLPRRRGEVLPHGAAPRCARAAATTS